MIKIRISQHHYGAKINNYWSNQLKLASQVIQNIIGQSGGQTEQHCEMLRTMMRQASFFFIW